MMAELPSLLYLTIVKVTPILLAGGQIAWWLSCRLIIDCAFLSPIFVLFVLYQSRQQNITKRQWFREQGIRWLGKGTMEKILPEKRDRRKFYMVKYRNYSNTRWVFDPVFLRDTAMRPEKESSQMQEAGEVVKAGLWTETNDKISGEGIARGDRMSRLVSNDFSSTAPAEQTTFKDAREHPLRMSAESSAIKPVEKDKKLDEKKEERRSNESGPNETRSVPPPNTVENSQASVRDTSKKPETLQEALDALDAEETRFEDAEADVKLEYAEGAAEGTIELKKEEVQPEKDTKEEEQFSDAEKILDTHTASDEKPPADTGSHEKATNVAEQERHVDADSDEEAVYDAENEQDPDSHHEESTQDFLARISREHNLALDLKSKPPRKKEKFDVQADFDDAPQYNGDSAEAVARRDRLFANTGLKVKGEKRVKKEVKSELGEEAWHGQNLEETDSEDDGDGDEEDWEDVDSGAGSRWNGSGRTWSEIRKEVVSGIKWWSSGGINSMGI
ncbi:uncharacterized protein PAC_14186 [Phialocephala subalpina]|uniref:Uncharacterized protein n=1 Tax=Phialocephala subalpina TaxID=576137 RepID=A0A1L7XH05_9HELO|nr:uncharacterized protein PAC_14186 [Phialocephala subalpina]